MNIEVRDRKRDVNIFIRNEEGRNIGEMRCNISEGFLDVWMSLVYREYRGKGYGSILYAEMIKVAQDKKLDIRSDTFVKIGAVNIYKSLKKKGYKVIKNRKAIANSRGLTTDGLGEPVFTIKIK